MHRENPSSTCDLVLMRNQNKEKLIPIVLFNQREIRGQIIFISRFTLPCKTFTLPVKPDKSSYLKKQYFSHDVTVCIQFLMTIPHMFLLQLLILEVHLKVLD